MSRVEERVRFERDGTVTALSGKMEYGQGLRDAYPRIVASELGVAPSCVHVVLGDTDLTPWDMGTFGSMSVEYDGLELRRAAAFARTVLLERAARRWSCAADALAITNGVVVCPDGRTATFAELTAHEPVSGDISDAVRLASPAATWPDTPSGPYRIDLVTGRIEFAGDVRLPGMLHGAVPHPATAGARLRSVDRDAASAIPGVVAIVQADGLTGVVAEQPEQARAALAALHAVWEPAPAQHTEETTVVLRDDGDASPAIAQAARRLSARYHTPHIAAAPLGPSVGLADVRPDGATVYASTQVPFRLRDDVARIASLPVERVHVKPAAMSGGFGRHGSSDAALEAARLSLAVRRPVRVQWGRADELRAAPHRPEMTAQLDAVLDANGSITAWHSEIWTNPYSYGGTSRAGGAPAARAARAGQREWASPAQMMAAMAGRNAIPPYDIGRAAITLHIAPGAVRTGALRSLGAAPNVFTIESFVDELAHAARQDPIAFRLAHTTDPRLRRVLDAVRVSSGWDARPEHGGYGVACVVYRHTCVAEVAQVSVDARGAVRLERVWAAVDAGRIVHPDGARNQIEGAIQMAASWTLIEALPHHGAEITGGTWADYPIATFADAPRDIAIVFTGDDGAPSYGLGEPPAVPTGPAIANAVYDACGARVRELPIRTAAVQCARAPTR